MRIAIVTDAWYPQINGVVRTLDTVRAKLVEAGHEVLVISPDRFRTIPCPTYPEIRLAILPGRGVARMLTQFAPDAIHIATEGPLGIAARRYCRQRRAPFTTSFHTKFPEYVQARFAIPPGWTYRWLRRFHGSAMRTMTATPSLESELRAHGFTNLARWTRGVDTKLFRPRDGDVPDALKDLPRPIYLYVGRVAVEKNIEAFLALDLTGTKLVVGDGPMMAELKRKYPDVVFAGAHVGEDLARHYAASDVFVFASRTDTFGLVLLEALASGLPVAAYDVTGPRDVLAGMSTADPVGVLDSDLAVAARAAVKLSPDACRNYALGFSWEASAAQFLGNLAPAGVVEAAAEAVAV
jgi:glycosyltransferase involved in cell wall biosynthesis